VVVVVRVTVTVKRALVVTKEAKGSNGEVGGRGRGRDRGRESRDDGYMAGLYLRGERRYNAFFMIIIFIKIATVEPYT
jgi:hypothetical protein